MSEFQLPVGFTLTAHTGCMGTKANTIESIDAGFNSGADVIEIDIRFLKNGVPVLSHNPVSKDRENSVVKLDAAFDCIKNYPEKKVNLDIKSTENLGEVQRLAKEKGVLNQVFFTGIYPNFVNAVRRDAPEISYYLNYNIPNPLMKVKAYLNYLVRKTKRLGAVGLNINKAVCSRELVELFHRSNLLVSVWTITDINGAKKYLSLSPDNITCKNPDEVARLLGRN
ncbi:MAG: glycerophosphodiester phosphodiesterase [Clostridiales bacterium]|nr:glycerophosphodiester phosphodiesterase [Clostridiales bacterium]